VVILYVDLDGFKAINDTHGHLSGDQVLQRFADRLRAAVPTHNRLARLGGDEFAIIQVLTEEGASPTEVAAEVTAALNAPVMIDHAVVGVGASVGVAVFPIDGTGPDQLLQRADMAMYRAKSEGRGQYRMFEADMAEAVIERRTLELELRGALGRDEFEVYYQPIVQLETGQVTAFEALLRWHHPTRGLLPGADFVNVAEDVGLIVEIGRWVLAQACRAAVEWPIDIKIAVNVSAVQFLAGDVLDAVTAALAESGLSAKRLELEITESALLDGSEANLETLTELRALGVSIAMDDFGTGHSSLAYLRRFPFDKIKIDQGFVRDMSSENSRAIVRAVASLGASLGIGTTAEGVETLLQLSYLREEGYKEVQGYYLGMPRPAAETLDFLADLERNIA
jgi:diguanylate cyclase (GGDEF)-like protein